MNRLPEALGWSLLLTLLLETAFFFLCGKRDRKDLCLLWLLNGMTNPPVVLFYSLASAVSLNRTAAAALLEAAAIAAEGWCYRRYGRTVRRPYLFSIAANLFSYGVGWMLGRIG
ncbi:MAG: hypothetical protein HFG26_11555 [Provencibacterium sp.]|jgi:hypothetical protein|nr:hypothetical protein [Provencibacterium sp.]